MQDIHCLKATLEFILGKIDYKELKVQSHDARSEGHRVICNGQRWGTRMAERAMNPATLKADHTVENNGHVTCKDCIKIMKENGL